jgi:acetyl-CoA carboxylase biotin carboxylase subunit
MMIERGGLVQVGSGKAFPYDKVLIANRGEIACRIIRACDELDLQTVAVYAANDANSLFVEMASTAVELPGEGLSETYLNSETIIEVAQLTGAGAIHPGFGFLSERADFARDVTAAGLIWIGPPPEAIDSMGDKMTARVLMRKAGVPVIPGEELEDLGQPDASQVVGNGGTGMTATQRAGLEAAASRVGYPILLKASAGGGGKGMRVVEHPDGLHEAWAGASREALTAFGDGRVYVERLLTGSRHVEIQVLADGHGNTIHLGERECSIQRRHQKVLEESPSTAVDQNLRAAMGEAAVAAAQAVDYVGAGTVEFLLADSGEFFFLEMNTRIQVEHPITEMVTGIDLVQEQLRIAAGRYLPLTQEKMEMTGHAIEVRLYAEDPEAGFLPAIGPLAMFRAPTGDGVRLDTGVREGDAITPDYDPMVAKLIVHADTRPSAIEKMKKAIGEFIVLGCQTNIGFLADLLAHPAFAAGQTPTNFIDTHWPDGWANPGGEELMQTLAGCAAAAESFGLAKGTTTASDDEDALRGDIHNPFLLINRRFP